MDSPTRRQWVAEEDEAILALVEEYGERRWNLIASKLQTKYHIKGRTGKQCRERWCNHVSPSLAKDDWSESDEARLFELHKVHGNKWSEIGKRLQNRSENCIKNHFYSTIRRNIKDYNSDHEPLNQPLKDLLKDQNLQSFILKPNYMPSRRNLNKPRPIRRSSRTKNLVRYQCMSSDEETQIETREETKKQNIDECSPVNSLSCQYWFSFSDEALFDILNTDDLFLN